MPKDLTLNHPNGDQIVPCLDRVVKNGETATFSDADAKGLEGNPYWVPAEKPADPKPAAPTAAPAAPAA